MDILEKLKEQDLENDKLFAKFMGIDFDGEYFVNTYNSPSFLDYSRTPDDMHFKTNWSWLMPVVQKINKMDASEFNYDAKRMTEFRWHKEQLINTKITSLSFQVHYECLSFIKWYYKITT